MQTIKDIFHIAKKDLIEFSRDKLRLATFIIMPIFMMILTGFIFPNQNTLKNIPIGIANLDNQQYGNQLVTMITDLKQDNQSAFKTSTFDSIDAIKNGIKKQTISGGIFIPKDFTSQINGNKQPEVIIVEDQSNPQISAVVDQILSNMASGLGQQIGIQKTAKFLVIITSPENQPGSIEQATAMMQPIKSTIQGIIPGNPNYFEFVAPGIMAMIVMTAVLTGLAAAISKEKEDGTLDGILISPINRLAIILGKATAQSIRGLIQGAIVLLLAVILFGVTIHGNLLLILLILLLGIFSFVGLGILVSAMASEQETATQLLFMFQFPMLFLSGVFFPILMMPQIMQDISKVIPLTYAINALRKVMVLGASFVDVRNELLILLIFGAVTLTIAVPVFKRVITK
ncbi:MAG: ABC transporter permease [Patescibacteria group bacterium]|jgi:ABC-2 type transport system permease protein